MKKYERLKENIDTLRIHNERHIPVLQLCDKTEYQLIRDIISDLTELIEKIEDGTLIEFPCKVGDTVYCVYSYCEDYAEIYCGKIRCLSISQNGTKWFSVVYDNGFAPEHILDEDWGITVFLTKAEAEARLKELRGEE